MNPLANEGMVTRIKKKAKKENNGIKTGTIRTELVGMNNAIPICAEACSCCWDSKIPEDYAGQAEYVAKRSRIGHTSVLEHSNYVLYLHIDGVYKNELITFLTWVNYLHTRVVPDINGDGLNLLIGGSYRGFADIYREADDMNNPILKSITGNLYTYANSAAFEDLSKLGIIDISLFRNGEPDENYNILTDQSISYENDLFKIIGLDSIQNLAKNIYDADPYTMSQLTTFDLIKFATVTVLFKDMSRTGTHQLVRHRNAITQESQRYVDYSNACFSNPADFKQDKYDNSHKYTVRFGPSAPMHLTLGEIGKAICDIYGMLHDPAIAGKEFALLKEDARGYLPSNVQCKKLYMTFTYKTLFKFLNLREDKAAQAEIRKYATSIGDKIREVTAFSTKDVMDNYTLPRLCIKEEPFKFDEDLGIKEEVIEMTEEDYLRATGLDQIPEGEESDNFETNKNLKNGDEV